MGNSKSKTIKNDDPQHPCGDRTPDIIHDFVIIHSVDARTFNNEAQSSEESQNIDTEKLKVGPSPQREKRGSIKEVDFEWHDRASRVYVSGSFDDWTTWTPLQRCDESKYKATLALDPGLCEIKFIVDGDWHHDPRYPVTDDSFGGYNNIISVE